MPQSAALIVYLGIAIAVCVFALWLTIHHISKHCEVEYEYIKPPEPVKTHVSWGHIAKHHRSQMMDVMELTHVMLNVAKTPMCAAELIVFIGQCGVIPKSKCDERAMQLYQTDNAVVAMQVVNMFSIYGSYVRIGSAVDEVV